MTHISWEVYNTCTKCKMAWGRIFHKTKITGIYIVEHVCLICGNEWITS